MNDRKRELQDYVTRSIDAMVGVAEMVRLGSGHSARLGGAAKRSPPTGSCSAASVATVFVSVCVCVMFVVE